MDQYDPKNIAEENRRKLNILKKKSPYCTNKKKKITGAAARGFKINVWFSVCKVIYC